jgi:hypothetical protein
MLIRIALTITCLAEALHLKRAFLAQRTPGEIEQIGDAGIFEALEGEGARVQDRRQSADRRGHMRDNADRAAERRRDTGSGAARQAGRQRIDDARARRDDDNERDDQEFEAHAILPRQRIGGEA